MTTNTTTQTLTTDQIAQIVDRYVAVWSEPDPSRRSAAIKDLWAEDASEIVEEATFHGHTELEARIDEAYGQFVGSGLYRVTSAGDAVGHHDVITFTIQLTPTGGAVAWAARVVLLLDDRGLIRRDYHVTVQELSR